MMHRPGVVSDTWVFAIDELRPTDGWMDDVMRSWETERERELVVTFALRNCKRTWPQCPGHRGDYDIIEECLVRSRFGYKQVKIYKKITRTKAKSPCQESRRSRSCSLFFSGPSFLAREQWRPLWFGRLPSYLHCFRSHRLTLVRYRFDFRMKCIFKSRKKGIVRVS